MANKIFRFALGDAASPHSGIWRLWTHEDEVHLAVRAATEDVGLTVYPTGRWKITVGTAASRWNRPKDFRPGWSRGPDLIIPHTELTVPQPAVDPWPTDSVHWLPGSAPGFQARFSLLIATPSAELSHWRPEEKPGTQGLVTLPLRTAGTVHLYRIDEAAVPDAPAPSPASAAASGSGATALLRVIISADPTGAPSFREEHGG